MVDRAEKLLMGEVSPPMYKRYRVIVEYNRLCVTFGKLQEDPLNYEVYKDLMIMFTAAHSKSRERFQKKVSEIIREKYQL